MNKIEVGSVFKVNLQKDIFSYGLYLGDTLAFYDAFNVEVEDIDFMKPKFRVFGGDELIASGDWPIIKIINVDVLLINEPDLLNWPDKTLMPALEECYHPSLSSLDIGIERLKDIAEFAVEETARMINGLGIVQ